MTIVPAKDGVDHINIYSKGKTSLGRALTNMFQFTFEYNGCTFHSVEQAWHYFKFLDINPLVAQHILSLENSYDCLKYARANSVPETVAFVQTDAFRNRIKDVIITRLQADDALRVQLKNSVLPFKHYFVYGADAVRDQSDKYSWLIQIFEDLRTELQFEYLDELLSKYGSLCYNMQTAPTNAVYVGRPKAGTKSPYGNPFPISAEIKALKGIDDYTFDKDVASSVMKYRQYLAKEIQSNPKNWYQHLQHIKGQPLKCFCTNGTESREHGARFCHSLILAQFANNCDEIYEALRLNVSNKR